MIVRPKTLAEKEAEDRWWLSLTQEQRRAYLDGWYKEDQEKEMLKAIVGTVVIVAYIIFAAIPAVIMFVRYW